jgi:hypothetical protein
MTARRRLPSRRYSETFTFEIGGLRYTCTTSKFEDGSLGEIFLGNHKAGSMADAAAKDSAVVASIALQYGVPVDVIRRALMRGSHGEPNTPLAAALDILNGGST